MKAAERRNRIAQDIGEHNASRSVSRDLLETICQHALVRMQLHGSSRRSLLWKLPHAYLEQLLVRLLDPSKGRCFIYRDLMKRWDDVIRKACGAPLSENTFYRFGAEFDRVAVELHQEMFRIHIVPLLLTPGQAAFRLRVSEQQVMDLVGAGELTSVRIGDELRIPSDAVREFVEANVTLARRKR